MALIRSGSVGTESPYLQYELYADQTGGSVNNRTIKITLKAKISSGYYGYPANWRANINGTWSGWMRLKGTESWNKNDGFRTFEYSATTDVGTTSSKAITVGFGVDSYNGDDSWDSTVTGSFTVGATNRPPNPPSNIIVRNGSSANSPVLNAGIVPENITTLFITWSAGSDPDGDQLTYVLNESINNGGYVQRDIGTDLAHSYNTSGWDEGGTIRFYVDARDTKGAWSNKTYSGAFTKNRLTAGTIYEYSNNINFNTKSFEARFRGGSNTDKSAVTYSCYSDSITIYNQTYTSDTKQTILIWRTGDATPASNQPYIKFNELVELYRSNNFTGTLSMGLFSKNTHGTKKSTAAAAVQVDLRVAPNPARNQSIVANSNHSPIYKKVAFSNNYYFIPDGSNVCRVHWNLGGGKLGEDVRYEVYVSYNNGGWQKLADVPQGTNDYAYYNHVIPKQTVSQQFKYLIRTITSYGYYSDAITPAQTLHFYNTPGISVGTITRGATTCDVKVTVKTNTSIPNVGTVGSWLTNPATSRGNLNASQGEQNIAVTGLTDAGTYTLKVTYNDNTGFSGNQVRDIAIGQNTPIFLINKYGIGINGKQAASGYALKAKGSIALSSSNANDIVRFRVFDGDANGAALTVQSGGLFIAGGGESAETLYNNLLANEGIGNGTERTYISSDTHVFLAAGCQNIANKKVAVFNDAGNLFVPGALYVGSNAGTGGSTSHRVYATNFKPTAADVGALPLTGGTLTGKLSVEGIKLRDKAGLDCNTYKTDEFWVNRTGNTSSNRPDDWCTVFNIGADNNANFQIACSYAGASNFWVRGRHDTSGNYQSWAKVYTTLNKPTAADVGLPLTTITKTLTVGTSWTNTGIVKSNLQSGSYMVQIYNNGRSDTELWDERWTGVMSWYDGGTNSNEVDEISLHCAGHANNGRHIYLRTVRTPSGGGLRLEIACSHNLGSSTYEFRFRKLI